MEQRKAHQLNKKFHKLSLRYNMFVQDQMWDEELLLIKYLSLEPCLNLLQHMPIFVDCQCNNYVFILTIPNLIYFKSVSSNICLDPHPNPSSCQRHPLQPIHFLKRIKRLHLPFLIFKDED